MAALPSAERVVAATSTREAPRRSRRFTVSPGLCLLMAARTSSALVIARPSTATISSPFLRLLADGASFATTAAMLTLSVTVLPSFLSATAMASCWESIICAALPRPPACW